MPMLGCERRVMKNLVFQKSKEVNVQDIAMKLKYYIVESLLAGSKYYGIAVEKYEEHGQDYILSDEDEVLGVTYSHETIVGISELLYNNEVTPCTLASILDDMSDNINRGMEPAQVAV